MPDSHSNSEAMGALAYIAASPTPYHACRQAADLLSQAGLTEVTIEESWSLDQGHFIIRGGTLFAFMAPAGVRAERGWTLVATHTDSPNLRLRSNPDVCRAGYRQLAVEVYGSPLLNSWLDRDLGISGRAVVEEDRVPRTRLFSVDRPLARVPQLAIHLDREINQEGLKLNRQTQMVPVWGIEEGGGEGFGEFLAATLGVRREQLLSWDAMLHPLEAPALWGRGQDFIAAPRTDNLLSSYCATRATSELSRSGALSRPLLLALFDHEEIGSVSASGAAGELLPSVLERLNLALGADRETHLRSLASSQVLSVDMAHAVHPNYLDRYEPQHLLRLNQGPGIKIHSNQRYATDAETSAAFALSCRRAGIPYQWFASRGDLPCGSTIGPHLAARLGVPTVDIGLPCLGMHSAREMAGAEDPAHLIAAISAYATRP